MLFEKCLVFFSSILFLCGADELIEGSGLDEGSGFQDLDSILYSDDLEETARFLSINAKVEIDEEEMIMLDKATQEFSRQRFYEKVLNRNNHSLEDCINNFQTVLYYAFKPFMVPNEQIWPNQYKIESKFDLNCIAYNLMEIIFNHSEFTSKYFSRAIHYGLVSKSPMEHRVSEMSIYKFLLPDSDRDWFIEVKNMFKASLWINQKNRNKNRIKENIDCALLSFIPPISKRKSRYRSFKFSSI